MAINIRQKGAEGERQVIKILRFELDLAITECMLSEAERDLFKHVLQRNTMQAAIGGNDISGSIGLSIEVKRQEALSINTWWKQCLDAAQRTNEQPLLIWRQNNKPWNAMTMGWIPLPNGGHVVSRVSFGEAELRAWVRAWFVRKIAAGWRPQA